MNIVIDRQIGVKIGRGKGRGKVRGEVKINQQIHINPRWIDKVFIAFVLDYLEAGVTYAEVALALNDKGWKNAWGNPYNERNIAYIHKKWGNGKDRRLIKKWVKLYR